MRRATWFVAGVAAGAGGANYAARQVRRRAEQLRPANVARSAADRARLGGRRVADAVREGRVAMRDREDELKARRDRRARPIDDQLDPGDELLVDGRPVESGRVIVLKRR